MPFSLYRRGRKGSDNSPPDVFIAVPCNSGRPCVNFAMSMVDSAVWMEANGIKFDFWLHTEDCHVDDARNFLVKQFMESGAKHLVFIDDDVGWDADGLAKLLCYQNADILGGAYPLKQQKEDYPVRIKAEPYLQARPDGLLEVDGVPTGFMRIERKVIEALSEKRKHLFFLPKEAAPGADKLQVIFERMMVDGRRWSGDLNFCREARALGFKVWVDPEMKFTHQGQMRWSGCLGNYLRDKNGVLDSRLDAAMERLIVGDSSPEVFNDIFKYYNQGYAAGPSMMKAIYDNCKEAKGPILEVGAGLSTIIAGLACKHNGQTVHALEHNIEWFRKIRNFIEIWKVKGVALYYAPLAEYPDMLGDDGKQPMMWYGDTDGIPDKFDLAIIDGPPRQFGRSGVYRLHLDKIKDAKWIVDDVEDKGQLALVDKFSKECGKTYKIIGSGKDGQRHYAYVT
jgi:hypothetical protein